MATETTHETTQREERFTRDPEEPATTASPLEQHAAPTEDTATRSGKATGGLICGILAILTGVFVPIVGLVLGVVAIVLGRTSRGEIKRTGKSNGWMATAAVALGAVGIVVSIAAGVANVIIMNS